MGTKGACRLTPKLFAIRQVFCGLPGRGLADEGPLPLQRPHPHVALFPGPHRQSAAWAAAAVVK